MPDPAKRASTPALTPGEDRFDESAPVFELHIGPHQRAGLRFKTLGHTVEGIGKHTDLVTRMWSPATRVDRSPAAIRRAASTSSLTGFTSLSATLRAIHTATPTKRKRTYK
jgi:hypothetical protein